jgi:hypothetical protein
MAKKNASTRRPMNDAEFSGEEIDSNSTDSTDTVTSVSVPEESAVETVAVKGKGKVADDPSANSNVSIGDIRKSVAFVNSVGGMDKALNLLQILKVAKEVQ